MSVTGFAYGELTTLNVGGNTGEVVGTSFSGVKREPIDTTVFGDTYKKFRPGLPDPGELTVTCYLASDNTFASLVTDATAVTGTVVFANSTGTVLTLTGTVIPLSYKINEVKVDGNVEAELTLKYDSLPTLS